MFLSVEHTVILLPLPFENHATYLSSKIQVLAKVPHYLNIADLFQGKNYNTGLLLLNFLLNLRQFYILYFWSLRGFCFYILKYIWDYFWHLYSGSWNSMFWHLLASLAICLLQAVILVLLLSMHLTKVLQVCLDLEFCKQWEKSSIWKSFIGV